MYLGVGDMYSSWQETCGGQRAACKSLFSSPPWQSQGLNSSPQTWQQEPYLLSHLAGALYNRGDSPLGVYNAQLSNPPGMWGTVSAGDNSACQLCIQLSLLPFMYYLEVFATVFHVESTVRVWVHYIIGSLCPLTEIFSLSLITFIVWFIFLTCFPFFLFLLLW